MRGCCDHPSHHTQLPGGRKFQLLACAPQSGHKLWGVQHKVQLFLGVTLDQVVSMQPSGFIWRFGPQAQSDRRDPGHIQGTDLNSKPFFFYDHHINITLNIIFQLANSVIDSKLINLPIVEAALHQLMSTFYQI